MSIEQRLENIERLLILQTKEVLTADECASYIGIKVTTLYNKVAKREIPHYKKGTILRFKKSELDNWLVSGEKVPTNEETDALADDYCVKHKLSI